MSLKGIRIEDKRIETVKQWPELQSIQDIQVFFGFANFYRQFIQRFSWIAAPLILMLKTLRSAESLTQPGKSKVGVGGGRKAGRDRSEIDDRKKVDNNEVEDNKIEKKVQKKSKSKNLSKSKKMVRSLDFLISRAKLVFIKLRQAFFKASILHHFDPKRHIQIKTDALGYAIGGVLNQLTLDNLGQWHSVAFFS